MINELREKLESGPAAVISGLLLLSSYLLEQSGCRLHPDPAWGAVLISGMPLLFEAIERLSESRGISKISSSLLITIAMIASIYIGDLFAAGEVAFIMALGELLEEKATERSKRGLHKLLSLSPVQGRRLRDGQTETVPAAAIEQGDKLRILPGETVPVDGIIISGSTSVDQSALTGESLPVDKNTGDEVFGGTLNRFGAIDIEATRPGSDSSLQRLIRLVQEAEKQQAPIARLADRAASWLVPLALLTAIAVGLFTQSLIRSVTILVVFCPCALVLATPTAIMAAIGQASKHGLLIKSGQALEIMGKTGTVALDKTGTLTFGRLEVCDLLPADASLAPETILALAASAEARSEHPLGKAIVAAALERSLSFTEPQNFQMFLGQGVTAETEGKALLCGQEAFLEQRGILIPATVRSQAEQLRQQGKVALLLAQDSVCLGVIGLADAIRPDAAAVVKKLRQLGVTVILLTGDSQLTAQYFAQQTGIDEVYAQLLPQDKVEHIRQLQQTGHRVCMIGDGINDAPSLKCADVGAAMAHIGSDAALEAADIAFMNDDISKIPYLKQLSDATVHTIIASITISMVINAIAVICSALGWLTPTTGALVHNAGSCFVVLFAAQLYDRRFAA